MPVRAVDAVLGALRARGILAFTGDVPPAWLPARDLATVNAKDLLDAVRAAGEDRYLSVDALPGSEPVERLLKRYDEVAGPVLAKVTLKDLGASPPERD